MNNNYHNLSAGEALSNFVNKKICFEAKISEIPAQHMMKISLNQGEKEMHEYLDPDPKYKSNQIVGYYYQNKVQFPENKKAAIKVYGSIQVMSGKGKGDGTHTEYYIDIDKVETLE